AGAKVNMQNIDGVSLLMILASFAEADEIRKALLAGADAKLKDVQGRTALDYLKLADCGQSPLRDLVRDEAPEEGKCRQLEKDNFRASKKLLEVAMGLTTQ